MQDGYDGDLQKRLVEPENEEEAERRAKLAKQHGKYGNHVRRMCVDIMSIICSPASHSKPQQHAVYMIVPENQCITMCSVRVQELRSCAVS
eukprot:1559104-Amphidinium_carterae.4